MKRFLAFLLAAVLVCSIAATALAACTHSYFLIHETVAGIPIPRSSRRLSTRAALASPDCQLTVF